jgi:hypothetical protein
MRLMRFFRVAVLIAATVRIVNQLVNFALNILQIKAIPSRALHSTTVGPIGASCRPTTFDASEFDNINTTKNSCD